MILGLLLVAAAAQAADMPIWPIDFTWSSAGPPANYECIRILETADPHTWDDNYFCWKQEKANPGMRWNSAGPIGGMRCTQILETADPHTWSDNYLCVPHGSPYDLSWSSAGQIYDKSCIKWIESADPNTWNDNFLCATPGAGGGSGGLESLAGYFPEPVFPNDFKWSSAGVPSGYDCVQILETADPHTWNDNFFCWKHGTSNPGMRWSSAGAIGGMRCTQILETADPHTWSDNYLCVPQSSTLRFIWSSAGAIKDHSCIQWLESADPHTWNDNYLCYERCQLTKLEVLNPDSYSPTYEGTQVIGVVSGGSCLGEATHTISLESVDTVEESVGVEVSETSEINWSVSASVQVEASAKLFGMGASVTVGLETSVGGSKSWSRSETKDFSEGSSNGVGQSTEYNSPGAAILFGQVDRYKFDQSNIPTKMHFTCPSGGSFIKDSTISLRATTYQAAHFEAMVGVFHKAACDADHSLPNCVRYLPYQYQNFFGDMTHVREGFKACFPADKGNVGK